MKRLNALIIIILIINLIPLPRPAAAQDNTLRAYTIYDVAAFPAINPVPDVAYVDLLNGEVMGSDPYYVRSMPQWLQLTDYIAGYPPSGSIIDPIDDLGDGWYGSCENYVHSDGGRYVSVAPAATPTGNYQLQVRAPAGSNRTGVIWGTWTERTVNTATNIQVLQNNFGLRDWRTAGYIAPESASNYGSLQSTSAFFWFKGSSTACDDNDYLEFRAVVPNTGVIRYDVVFNDGVLIDRVIVSYRSASSVTLSLTGSDTISDTFSAAGSWTTETLEVSGAVSGSQFLIEATGNATIDIQSVTISYADMPRSHYVHPLMPDDAAELDLEFLSEEQISGDVIVNQIMWQPWKITEDPPLVDSNEYTIYYESNQPGAYVHAATDAIVTGIEPIDISDCTDGWTGSISGYTTLIDAMRDVLEGAYLADVLASMIGSQSACELFSSGTIVNNTWHMIAAGHIVTIQDIANGRSISYLVADPSVVDGQMIPAGCVLGQTLPLAMSAVLVPAAIEQRGAGLIWAESEIATPFDISPNFDIWPWSNEKCSGPDFGDCLNLNATFSDPGSGPWIWSFAGSADRNPTGEDSGLYLLSSGDNDATQTIAGSAIPYSVKIAGYVAVPESDSTASEVEVTFGDTTHSFNFPASGDPVEFVTELQTYSDSDYSGSIYDLSVNLAAGEDGAVVITFLCVDDSADPLSNLPSCIVPNPGFDSAADWMLTDAAANVTSIGNGLLTLEPYTSAVTSITVQLRPDTYNVELRMRGQPMMVPPVGGVYNAHVDWIAEDVEANGLGTGYATATTDQFEVLDAGSFTVASLLDPGVTIELNANNAGDTAEIDYVCLVPVVLPTGPDDGGPSAVDCNACPRTYIGDLLHDVPESVDWLACELNRTYYCDARQIMVDTRTATEETVRGVGMLGRWFQATFSKQATFFKSLAFFLGGYLNNVGLMIQDAFFYSGGASTVIYEDQPASLFDVLAILLISLRDIFTVGINGIVQVLSYLVPIAEILRDVAMGIFALVEDVIAAIASAVQNVVAIFAAIVDAMNADPATIEGAPNCDADLASGDANLLCWGFYILDNTIWSGPAGYMIPILVAAAALNLLIWVFEQFREAITNAA